MKYFPQTSADITDMLKVVGVGSLDELFAEIPEELKLHHSLNLPKAQSEMEVRKTISDLASENKTLTCFAGAGVYDHYLPSVIPYIASRSEFSTSYTPYQAEISQGTLQYIFEYQTMMARLTGMDISNASMYDGATATAEAMMMCVAAAKKRNRVILSETMLGNVVNVVRTYAHYHGVDLVVVKTSKNGTTDWNEVKRLVLEGDVAGVIVPLTNRYGIIEDLTGVSEFCHEQKTLLVVNSIASVLGVLKSPGEWGADIACGDAQSLGIPMSYGGPYIGYLCTNNALVRKMPGRLVGETTDARGNRCFVLTLQAREQHIRREKATSNICTAQGMMCLYVAAYLSLMGEKGLREVNEISADGAHLLCEKLTKLSVFEPAFPEQPYLNEFTLKYSGKKPLAELLEALAQNGILAGVVADGHDDMLTIAVTEKRTPAEVEYYVSLISQLL